MRFLINKLPENEEFQPNEAWNPLKESTNLWMIQLQALPFMVFNVAIIIVLMWLIGIRFDYNSGSMLLAILIVIPVHELIHALFFPDKISSKQIYFGFMLKGLAAFAAYTGILNRNRFIIVLLAPFVIISFLGLLWLAIFGENGLIEHIVVFNALGSCADALGTYLILKQVPANAIIRNKGIRTYWTISPSSLPFMGSHDMKETENDANE